VLNQLLSKSNQNQLGSKDCFQGKYQSFFIITKIKKFKNILVLDEVEGFIKLKSIVSAKKILESLAGLREE
jgi:hypothetical protein